MPDYWSGLDAMVAAIGKARDAKNEGARAGIGLALRNTLDTSNRHVPHEEGDLERDGGTAVDPDRLRGVVAYGRSADTAKYAVPQHERMDYKHDAGRSAKFLEQALAATADENSEIIGQQIRTRMEGA